MIDWVLLAQREIGIVSRNKLLSINNNWKHDEIGNIYNVYKLPWGRALWFKTIDSCRNCNDKKVLTGRMAAG